MHAAANGAHVTPVEPPVIEIDSGSRLSDDTRRQLRMAAEVGGLGRQHRRLAELLADELDEQCRTCAAAVVRRLWSMAFARNREQCDHGLSFDAAAAATCSVTEIRRRWPRIFGQCPKGCGYSGIAYASSEHMIAGDW